MSVGLFVYGSQGGLGKSRTVLRTLAEEGVSPVLVNSHITPLALYATLYYNRSGKVIFFDDVDSASSARWLTSGSCGVGPVGRSQDRHLRVQPAG